MRFKKLPSALMPFVAISLMSYFIFYFKMFRKRLFVKVSTKVINNAIRCVTIRVKIFYKYNDCTPPLGEQATQLATPAQMR